MHKQGVVSYYWILFYINYHPALSCTSFFIALEVSMWECLKSVLLLMASRGPAPLVMNMSLHLSSFMNSQSFFLIFLRCSRTLHHVQLVECNVNSPRTSLHCKKQTINRQTRGFLHGPSPSNDEIYVMQLADVERIIEVLLNILHKEVHWAMGRWHS